MFSSTYQASCQSLNYHRLRRFSLLTGLLTSAIIQSCSACILSNCWTCSFVVIISCITTQASLKKHIPSRAVTRSLKATPGPTVNWPSLHSQALYLTRPRPLTLPYLSFFNSMPRRELWKHSQQGCRPSWKVNSVWVPPDRKSRQREREK